MGAPTKSVWRSDFLACSWRNPIAKDLMPADARERRSISGTSSFCTRCIDFRVAETAESPNKTGRFRPETLKPETPDVSSEGTTK